MTPDKPIETHDKVESLLKESKLHDAFARLRELLSGQNKPELLDLLNKQEDTYRYMIHYLVEGFADNERDKMLSEIVSTLYFINDSILRERIAIDSPDLYSATLRFERIRGISLQSKLSEYKKAYSMALLGQEAGGDLTARMEADEALLALFSSVWTMFGASTQTYKTLSETVNAPENSFELKAQIISGLLLGNLAYFDKKALHCLMDIFEADADPRITARSLVAIVLIAARHPQRLRRDKSVENRMSLWQDSIMTYRQLREVVMSIIRSHDTERISNKMQNEVIPELMKLRPEILSKLRNFSEVSDLESLDVNPEWEDILDKNGIGDKLKELTEMQMEGGDVMMMAFSNLKSFPFFNNAANWFLPYSSTHHELQQTGEDPSSIFGELLDMQGVMCDSDKYSFSFSLSRMPESQRKMLTERMNEQMDQIKEAMAEKQLKSTVPEFDSEVTRYVRDIYRFFKLFRKKNEFQDPFAKPLDLYSLPYLSDILEDTEILSLVGEFYFKRGYYAEALPILLKLGEEQSEDPLVWEKTGYCLNSLGNLDEAVKWYRKAELVHPDSQWLIKKMALCLRLLNRYDEAAEYYSKALEKDPDNYKLLMSSGNCLLENEKTKEALSNYYHAEYVRPGRIATLRAIAWGEMINHNFPKSLDYYEKILGQAESGASDLLNAGHVNYLSGNFKQAVECYKRAAMTHGYNLKALANDLKLDTAIIKRLGGKQEELNLMLDKVKYDLGE